MNLFNWLATIIDSCTDDFHFEGVDKLIDLFSEKVKDNELTETLKGLRAKKWNDIHGIVKPELNK